MTANIDFRISFGKFWDFGPNRRRYNLILVFGLYIIKPIGIEIGALGNDQSGIAPWNNRQPETNGRQYAYISGVLFYKIEPVYRIIIDVSIDQGPCTARQGIEGPSGDSSIGSSSDPSFGPDVLSGYVDGWFTRNNARLVPSYYLCFTLKRKEEK